jgi:hypothetical protein
MEVFDLEVVTANDELVTFERGYLYHHNDADIKSWDVEIIGTNNDNLFQEFMDQNKFVTLKMASENGKNFMGTVMITNYSHGPLGSRVLLTGSGPLHQA